MLFLLAISIFCVLSALTVSYVKNKTSLLDSKSIKNESAVFVHTISYNNKKTIYSVTCPHCDKHFHPIKSDLKVKKYKNKNDIGYLVCPKCGERIVIQSTSLIDFGYVQDFLGNILIGNHKTLENVLYTVDCDPCCSFPNSFKYKDTFSNFTNHQRYIFCKLDTCGRKIFLSKDKVRVIRNPDSKNDNYYADLITAMKKTNDNSHTIIS